jgi:hypothetical protein
LIKDLQQFGWLVVFKIKLVAKTVVQTRISLPKFQQLARIAGSDDDEFATPVAKLRR